MTKKTFVVFPGIPYTYIASPMPAIYRRTTDAIPRGVSNRRAALNWIRLNHDANDSNAVIYFGDDDNTFHLDLFKEIRTTKKISMFPVGLIGEYGVSSPIIDKVSNNSGRIIITCTVVTYTINLGVIFHDMFQQHLHLSECE